MGMLSQILVYMTVTFLQPTLSLHLEKRDFTPVFIGMAFAIPTLIYASTSPMVYVLTARIKKSGVIFIGYLISSAAMFLIGPSLLFGFPDSTSLTMVGLCLMGFGAGMIIIPVLPDMIESTEERYPGIDMDKLHNNISGLFISA